MNGSDSNQGKIQLDIYKILAQMNIRADKFDLERSSPQNKQAPSPKQ